MSSAQPFEPPRNGAGGADGPTPDSPRRRRGRRRRGGGGPVQPAATPQATDPTPPTAETGGTGTGGAPVPGPRLVGPSAAAQRHPPKPSDLATAIAKRPAAPTPQSTDPRKKNRVRGPRLRTVRETSAGGLVVSDLSRPFDELVAALIGRVDRRGRMMWSLPKGHIETGETAEQTAVREVAEETGIQGSVVASLGKIDYWFVSEGRRIHKTVHHYLLRSTGGELSDADYEVAEVAWVPLVELPKRLTYSDERRLARMAEGVIADLAADPGRLAQSEAQNSRTEPNEYEKAAAARNQRRKDPVPPPSARRRRRRGRRPPTPGA